MGVRLEFRGVTKMYGGHAAVRDVTFAVESGEFFTLLGPSGCGKTTLLRMAAGFNTIEAGEILFDGAVINARPAHLRNIGMVFQNYAVFPHMSVGDNVAYGLSARRLPKAEITERVKAALDLVQMDRYRDRSPGNLSGGQQQRVALARAIVIRPDILLMDEPLSNLDAKLRVQMRATIKRIQQELGITTLYVTHDQEEALAVSDRIAVMRDGRILQIGLPRGIYARSGNTFVASFIGTSNMLAGTLVRDGAEGVGLRIEDALTVRVPELGGRAPGERVVVAVRPGEFTMGAEAGPGLHGSVIMSTFLGDFTHCLVGLDCGREVEVHLRDGEGARPLSRGSRVSLGVAASKINVFDSSGEVSLTPGGEE